MIFVTGATGRMGGAALDMAAQYAVQRSGKAARVSGDFQRLTGRPAGRLSDCVERECDRLT